MSSMVSGNAAGQFLTSILASIKAFTRTFGFRHRHVGHYLLFGKGERREPMPGWKSYTRRKRMEVLEFLVPVRQEKVAVRIVKFNDEEGQLERCVKSAEIAFSVAGLPRDNSTILIIDNGEASHVVIAR